MLVHGASFARLRLPHRVQRNALSNGASNALGLVLQLIVIGVTGQFLQTPDYATYLVAMALVGVAEIGSDFGTRVWAAQRFALVPSPYEVLPSVLTAKAFYSLVMLVAICVTPLEGFSFGLAGLCGLIALTQPGSDPAIWYLRGTERLDIEAVVVIINRVSVTLAACLLAWAGFGSATILISWLASNLIRVAIEMTLPACRRLFQHDGTHEPMRRASAISLPSLVAATLPLGSSLLLMSLFQRAGVFAVNAVGTPLDVAVYGTCYKFVSAASFLATSVAVAHFPALVRHADSLSIDEASQVVKTEIAAVTVIFGPLCLAGLVIGTFNVGWVSGPAWSDAGQVLAALMPGLYISSVNIATKFTLNAFGRNWLDATCNALGLLAFCLVFLVPSSMSPGIRAAFGWTIGETIVFGLRRAILRQTNPAVGMQAPVVLSITGLLAVAAIVTWQIS
jgi:O-antigen/teichoic acid export membrane protein